MIVETHENLKNFRRQSATRTVVYDRFNNPIMVAIETSPQVTLCATIGDPEFEDLLRQAGVHKVVRPTLITPNKLVV